MPKSLKINGEMEKRKIIVQCFSVARNMSKCGHDMKYIKESGLNAGTEFLEANKALSPQQEARLLQMGAMIRNGSFYLERLNFREEKENLARNFMGKMSMDQLFDLLSFYRMMGKICSEAFEIKQHGLVSHLTT